MSNKWTSKKFLQLGKTMTESFYPLNQDKGGDTWHKDQLIAIAPPKGYCDHSFLLGRRGISVRV